MATHLKNLSEHSNFSIHNADSLTFGIVISEWNNEITNALYEGAYSSLIEHGILQKNINTLYVPGTYELAYGAQNLLEKQSLNGVICLGCVIQGETKHFDFICQAAANGIMQVGLQYKKPVIFGVLTTDNLQQAQERSGGVHGNKGVEAAITALKMCNR